MTRLMFLMFCEDSGLIAPNAFRDYVSHFQAGDLRRGLKDLFVWLDTKDEDRDKYAESWLKKLPYMNGGLFREETEIPPLSESFRYTLIVEGCQEFDWAGVSPTVFGSIFEGALSHDHRRANGQHFTSPENIHKVIDPLFLNGLKAELEEIKRIRKFRSLSAHGKRMVDIVLDEEYHRFLEQMYREEKINAFNLVDDIRQLSYEQIAKASRYVRALKNGFSE